MEKIKQYREFFEDERNSALLYSTLAEIEKDPRLSEVYKRIAETELRHAAEWAARSKAEAGIELIFSPRTRTRILIWLAKKFGPAVILPGIQAMESNGSGAYVQAGAKDMAGEEASHNRLIGMISNSTTGGFEGGKLAQLEGRHRSAGGNALRAAVLGANDGLVSNLSLVMGVAGATMNNRTILITGLAGLLAGAISMALGEWLSVQSSRELYNHQIEIEKAEIEQSPAEEAEELALIYESRGLSADQARIMADQILSDSVNAVQTLAREELSIDPDELGGSAWEAALTSFLLFAIGALIPVVAFTFLTGWTAVITSILLSTVGLFILGAVITLFTGRGVLYSGLRMVIFGLMAAAVTFGIGKIIGVSIAG